MPPMIFFILYYFLNTDILSFKNFFFQEIGFSRGIQDICNLSNSLKYLHLNKLLFKQFIQIKIWM